MDIYTDSIQNLSEPHKLLLVQRIWDDLEPSDAVPLPKWLVEETQRRGAEMLADTNLGLSYEEILNRIRAWRDG